MRADGIPKGENMSAAFENAKMLARANIPVFSSSLRFGNSTPTCNLPEIERIHARDPEAMWLARTGSHVGLLALDTHPNDLDTLVAALGPLPRTIGVSRAGTSNTVYWLRVGNDAAIKLERKLLTTRAAFRKNAVVPGSIHPKSAEAYTVTEGGAFDVNRMAWLPRGWIEGLAEAAPRYEWSREEFLKGFRHD